AQPYAQPREAAVAAPIAPAQVADLLARFAKGAGLPVEDMLKRDAGDLMEDLGTMMRIVVENMMALNTTRRATKALMRSSEHTQLSVHDNNPIKSLPTAEMVLKYMLGPASRAYQDGARALHGSFDDLHKHQERVFIAMQQAMKMLHEDIDPAVIDHSVEPDRGIGSLVVPRKSRLWDQYVARWQAKTMRSEDGIVGLFMIYFADCYDRLGSNDPY
ncbi:MAG: type VI secretion system-associated FHA domain protein TagH, partial [Ancalomicrobiaceae bacterium]|nr:type VI secretion system-associated FHA domain protein TagH [Ancalomicrobiaceae bacterium]